MSVKSSQLPAANKPISCSLSSNFQISPFILRRKGAINLLRLAGAFFDDEPRTMEWVPPTSLMMLIPHSSVTYLFCTYMYALIILLWMLFSVFENFQLSSF